MLVCARIKLLILINISLFKFYIGYIEDISMDIFIRISIYQKLDNCDQFITIRSSQSFKFGYLNISLIYPNISLIFY